MCVPIIKWGLDGCGGRVLGRLGAQGRGMGAREAAGFAHKCEWGGEAQQGRGKRAVPLEYLYYKNSFS